MYQTPRIPDNIIKQLQEDLIGKRVRVKTKLSEVVGMCSYVGYNEFIPSYGLQVTVDRTPFTNLKLENITLLEQSDEI